ncbi:MAG: hypothetical protein FWB74_01780 [Defluviitaleaceae bacterium]|nr:hypothetical protein [Defluviitaleaceae bacterium]
MMGEGKIFVGLVDGAIKVNCRIAFDEPVTEFRFSLSTLLNIDDLSEKCEVVKTWVVRSGFHEAREYLVKPKNGAFKELVIDYSGTVSGWHNVLSESRIGLYGYSVWYPLECSIKLRKIESTFNDTVNYDVWYFGSSGIFALKKGYGTVSSACGNFNVHYVNPGQKAFAKVCAHHYGKIIDFYQSMFCGKDIGITDVLFMDIEGGSGAIIQDGLMVVGQIPDMKDADEMQEMAINMLGHEFGHYWFKADHSTWEAWLGETAAEWASILYMVSVSGEDSINSRLDQIQEWTGDYVKAPVIKTPDLLCPPSGVHVRGVMLFYEIYKRHGLDKIKHILTILANLEIYNTESLLLELDEGVSDFIRRGLDAVDYMLL